MSAQLGLILSLVMLTLLAILFLIINMRHNLTKVLPALIILPITALFLYGLTGQYGQVILAQDQAQNTPQVLIIKLKDYLASHPNDAKAYYLLGRLYANQGQKELASRAFKEAMLVNKKRP